MKNFFLLFILSLLFMWACSNGGSSEERKTESGYTYVMHVDESGPVALEGEYAYFHWQIRNGDSVMHTTRSQGLVQKAPISYETPPGGNAHPIPELLKFLSKGDSATVYLPLDSFPPDQVPPELLGKEFLFYDVVMLDIKTEAEFQAENDAEQAEMMKKRDALMAREEGIREQLMESLDLFKAGKLGSELKTTPSGLQYLIYEQGTGKKAESGKNVSVLYYGILPDGTMFDNSLRTGGPFSFLLGRGAVIPGWDEGLALLNEGGKAVLFIPPGLAYGEQGSPPVIPANSDLVFYVELEEVK
ncbi:MAG: FKBP-type peptidyl-prolyl cis-trans isomerase [Bacteroidetes bacterium]|nr:FKBP-type peptidyl-prolyl cis-trans isomerase [Bacteroidota bacterium]